MNVWKLLLALKQPVLAPTLAYRDSATGAEASLLAGGFDKLQTSHDFGAFRVWLEESFSTVTLVHPRPPKHTHQRARTAVRSDPIGAAQRGVAGFREVAPARRG